MFFDACNSDGYLYELDCDGHVLCRNRSTSDWIDGEPPESIDASCSHQCIGAHMTDKELIEELKKDRDDNHAIDD